MGRKPEKITESLEGSGRDRLIMVAMRLFADRGFDAVTVRDIAAEAQVSIGLINHHFTSKQGLRDAVDAHFTRRTSAAIDQAIDAVASHDFDRIAAYQRDWITRYAAEWPPFVAYMRRAVMDNSPWGRRLITRYYDSIRHMIDRFDAQGKISPQADRLWLPVLYLFLLTGPLVLAPWIEETYGISPYDPESWGRLQRATTALFWHGCSPAPAAAGSTPPPPGRLQKL